MPKKVLSVSSETRLLITRNNALAVAGYSVSSPRTIADSVPLLASEDFRAVVIGDSVPDAERAELIARLRETKPGIPILFVTVIPGRTEPHADQNLDVSSDIAPLFEALGAIVPPDGDGR